MPAAATFYIIEENGDAFLNMTCVLPKYRGFGFGP